MQKSFDKVLSILIAFGIFSLLLSPFPYATVETWSISLFEIISFVTFGLWVLRDIIRERIKIVESPLYIPFGLFFIFIIIQIIPMPLSFLKIISPHTEALLSHARDSLSYIFGQDTIKSFTLSINPYATKEKLLLYLSYGAFFLVSSNYIVSRDQLKKYFWVIFSVGLIQSLIGISQYIASSSAAPASGTYVNPNHFGGLLILIIPVCLGYILYLSRKQGQSESLLSIIRQPKFSNQLLIFFATGLMAVAVVMSKSRGALISVVASVLVFYVLMSWRKKTRSGTIFIALFITTIAAYSLWIGIDPVIEKFADTAETLPLRTYIWKDTLSMIKDFPILGTGLGTYPLSYSLYKEAVYWPTVVQHAHNDYLELLSETGIIGFLLVFSGLVMSYRNALSSILNQRTKKDPLRYFLLIGVISGTLGMMIHAITEFNFQIPANVYYFTFLLGLSVSMSYHIQKQR